MAMGSAVVGSTGGFEAVWYNPAGMAYDEELTFAFGYQHGFLELEINDEPWAALDTPALVFGFGIPLPLGGVLEDRISMGMGFVLPTTSILIADTKAPGDLTYVLLENRAQTVSIMGGLAMRILDELSIGWSMLALAELDGAIDVGPNESGRLGSQARDQLVTAYSNAVGVMVRPLPNRLGLGLVWRQASAANYALPISVELGDEFRLPVPVLDISGVAQYDPAQVSASVWGRPTDWLHLEFGMTHKRWARFENPIVYTAVPDEYPPQPVPGFSNTTVWRAGVEGRFERGDWSLRPRLGFAYEPSPAPEQTGLHNYLDSDRSIPSLGLGFRLGVLTVDTAWQMHLLADRDHEKDGCVEVEDGFWDLPLEEGMEVSPAYPSVNPGCPGVSHGGTIQVVNLQLGVAF